MTDQEETPKKRRWLPLLALLAGLCWALVITIILRVDLIGEPNLFSPWHLLFYILTLGAGILTFWPLETWLELPGLTIEGTLGVGMLLVTLAMVPAPDGTLLDQSAVPAYLVMLIAVLLSVAAIVRPVIAVLSRRWLALRAWALDNRRVRREAYECGLFVAAILALAALRTLDPIKFVALAVIIVLIEILLLSFIGVEPA
ncbi:MAG: hypothetical protein WHS83_18675 [Chloroflexus sp.]|uniref:hypothetical protein n=1 Tax=Chloroflexus sp. TaxID=1904827 RepID=UPI00309896BB